MLFPMYTVPADILLKMTTIRPHEELKASRPARHRHYEHYSEGQGDLVSRSIMGISRVITCVIGIINLLTKSP